MSHRSAALARKGSSSGDVVVVEFDRGTVVRKATTAAVANRTRRVLDNALFLAFARFGGVLTMLLLTPYIVRQLGVETYGLWAVLSAVAGYVSLLDLGLGTSFVRCIADYAARREMRRVRQVACFGLLFYLALGALLFPVIHAVAPRVIGLLRLPPALQQTAANALVLTCCIFFLTNSLGTFAALLNGLERMRATSLIMVGGQIAYAVMAVVLVRGGLGIYGLILASAMQVATNSILCFIVARKAVGPLFRGVLPFERHVIRQLFVFGGWMQLNNLSRIVNLETDRVIIASVVNVTSAAYYDIGNKLALLTRFLPEVFLGALLPTASVISAQGEQQQLDDLYAQASRAMGLVAFAVAGYIVGASAPLVRVWLGQSYPFVAVIVPLLAVAYVMNILTGVGTTLVRALGIPHYEAQYAMVSAVANVLLTLALATRFGLYGVLIGTVVGTVLGSAYFLWRFHRLRHLPLWQALGSWLWRLAAATAVATALLRWAVSLAPQRVFAGRAEGLALLFILGVGYGLVLLCLLRVTRFLGPSDLRLLRTAAPARVYRVLDLPIVHRWFGAFR